MEAIFELPGKLYDYINYQYGFIGLLVAGILLVMGVLMIFFWFDRRKI